MIKYTAKQYEEALNRLAATSDGKIVLSAIKERCGWDHTTLSSDNLQATQYYATLRGVYSDLRVKIKPELLKEIEFDYKGTVEDDRIGSSRISRVAARSDRAPKSGD